MRHVQALAVLYVAAIVAVVPAQNLITNPGFESGTASWSAIWSRTAGAATATIVSNPVHSGSSAIHIRNIDTEDWSYAPSTGFPLTTRAGLIYEFSAWVRVDTLGHDGRVEISTVLRNQSGAVTNWSYAVRACTLSTGSFRQYVARVVVPDSCASIAPRIIGADTCVVILDDVSFRLVDSLPASVLRPYTLLNSQVRATVKPSSFVFDVRATGATRSHVTMPSGVFEAQAVDSAGDSLVIRCVHTAGGWPAQVTLRLEGPALRVTIRADSASLVANEFVFPGPIPSLDNDHAVLGKGTGIILPVRDIPPYLQDYRWMSLSQWQVDMSLAGITDMTEGYALASADPWYARIQLYPPDNAANSALSLVHTPAKHRFGSSSRTLYLAAFAEGGYVSIARWYRQVAEKHGWVRTLAQKASQTPNIDRLRGAVDWWNTGPGPWHSQVSFYRDLKGFGIDRAVINGLYSRALIDTLNAMGYLTSVYDVYCDAYPPGNPGYGSDGYNSGAIVKEDGSYELGWLAYLDGGGTLQAQEVCAATHSAIAIPRITADRQSRPLNCRFIDVELAIGLQECWSAVHPVDRRTDAMARMSLFDTLRTAFGLVLGAEQARDFAFPHVDYGEGTMSFAPVGNAGYDWATPVPPDSPFSLVNINPAIHVPLHGLTYHDVHIPTWYTGDGVSKVPAYWDDKDLFNILYASMPLFMPPDSTYWRVHQERFLTSYHLVSAVTRGAGFADMTNHQFVNAARTVQRTEFDNGWSVTVNFDSTSNHMVGSRTLPPKGFVATGPGHEVYRALEAGQRVALARTPERLFLNGYGTETSHYGLRTSGCAFLRKDSSSIHLAFTGAQASVDINPSQLPWPMAGVRVVSATGLDVPLSALTGGWQQLTRLPSTPFYRIEGTFGARTGTTGARGVVRGVRIAPDGAVVARGWLSNAGLVVITLFDMNGRVTFRHSAQCVAGPFTVRSQPGANRGASAVRVQAGGSDTRSVVVRAR